MNLFIIDGIGPFFHGVKTKRLNWSKIPFDNLETAEGQLDHKRFDLIEKEFVTFVKRASKMGFNGVTLDDVAHLTPHPRYPEELIRKIADYRSRFATLFEIAKSHGMDTFLTTDIMFYNEFIERWPGRNHAEIIKYLQGIFDELFASFPRIRGIVFRIGECDGLDVRSDFRSRLTIRTPGQARSYLKALLPVFERHKRYLIFRTWTVGAYRIGDLMWNRDTFDLVFKGIESDSLVISLKYGESDFFRFLPLNKLFFRTNHQKIIELQTRREYEGFGEYPSFIGWDYENYARELCGETHVIGACFWCQTGGWTTFRSRTFIKRSSIWNEINTFVALRVFKERISTEEAVKEYCLKYLKVANWEVMLTLLRLSDEVVKELLYIDDFARQKIFFRRLRVPPLISVFWDYIIISDHLRRLLLYFVEDGRDKIQQGRAALRKIQKMKSLAKRIGIPPYGLKLQYETFKILAVSREYYFGEQPDLVIGRLEEMRVHYRKMFRRRYSIKMSFNGVSISSERLRPLLSLLIRHQRGYRLIDRVFVVRILSLMAPLLKLNNWKFVPGFARKRAMGFKVLLK